MLLDEQWFLLREGFTANALRTAEIIRAFAAASGGVRESNRVAEHLLRVAPVLRGEFAYLGQKWPEMHTFLAAHGLAIDAQA